MESKNPILLPTSHPFVELLIHHTHQSVKHSSVNNTLTMVRERLWILWWRQAVKRVLRHCMICKKLEGLSFPTHISSDLLGIRVFNNPLFTHVGINFAGPLHISASSDSKSDNEKCYNCLFRYATTRVIHLELTQNLTVDTFLLAFRGLTR